MERIARQRPAGGTAAAAGCPSTAARPGAAGMKGQPGQGLEVYFLVTDVLAGEEDLEGEHTQALVPLVWLQEDGRPPDALWYGWAWGQRRDHW